MVSRSPAGTPRRCIPVSSASWTRTFFPWAFNARPWSASTTVCVRRQRRSNGTASGGVYPRIRMVPPDASLPQGNAFGQAGHGKGPDAGLPKSPAHWDSPMAVSVGLDHRHELLARRQGVLQHLGIVGQRVKIQLPPRPGFGRNRTGTQRQQHRRKEKNLRSR